MSGTVERSRLWEIIYHDFFSRQSPGLIKLCIFRSAQVQLLWNASCRVFYCESPAIRRFSTDWLMARLNCVIIITIIIITSCAGGRHNMPPPHCDLDLWPFDLESGILVTNLLIFTFPTAFAVAATLKLILKTIMLLWRSLIIIIITRIWHIPAKHANRMDARAHSSTLAECAPRFMTPRSQGFVGRSSPNLAHV